MRITEQTRRFIQILGKIPMFQRLAPGQAMEILKICTPSAFAEKQMVCKYGTKSTEMYILLSGKLVITAPDGTPLAYLSPITTVGEMGVITNQPRSATVIAAERTSVFLLSKIKLEVLIKRYPDVGFVIYRNIIQTLSERLNGTNKQLAVCQRELAGIRESGGVLST